MLIAVNVDVAVHRKGKWLLIVRGAEEAHAAGMLSLVGGTLESEGATFDILEATARREVKEEVGVDLVGALHYVESTFFTTASGTGVLNVVMRGEIGDQMPVNNAPDEVAGIEWRTVEEIAGDKSCPSWTLQSIQRAACVLTTTD
ncbi:MAG: NUDIX hydrolase [Rhodoglobus sp.]